MLKKLALMVAAAACIAGTALAQDDVRPVQGAKYLGGGGRWQSIDGENLYQLNVNFGMFFTNRIVGEVQWGYLGFDGDDAQEIMVKGKYLLTETGAVAPYLQVGAVHYRVPGENDTTYLFGGGFDYYMNPTTAFYVDLAVYKPDSLDEWVYGTTFGFRFFFN